MKPGCALQEHKIEKRTMFEKCCRPSKAFTDRVAVHLIICNQHLERSTATVKSVEEHYDYARLAMTSGLRYRPRANREVAQAIAENRFRHLPLARFDCLTGHVEAR